MVDTDKIITLVDANSYPVREIQKILGMHGSVVAHFIDAGYVQNGCECRN